MRICILGATGLVGRETIDLCGRAWPNSDLLLFASRDQVLVHHGESLQVRRASLLAESQAPRGELAFVALDDDHSKRYVPRLLELGYRVIDKSNTYRLDPSVPLVAAGVNQSQVNSDTPLVANPNCTTVPLVLTLSALAQRFELESVTISTYQAVSGAGIAALDEFLEKAQVGYRDADRRGLCFDPGGYAGNCVPHNGGTDDSGFSSEERKLMLETRKIMALPNLQMSVQCCRVAVAMGHYMNAWIRFRQRVDAAEAAAAIQDVRGNRFLRFYSGPTGEGISALACVRDRDNALVGRLRQDIGDPSGRTLCATIAGDNIRLGAATNAVRIASRWFPSAASELQVEDTSNDASAMSVAATAS